MDFFEQVNEHIRDLSDNERTIFEYVVRHSSEVADMNIRTLANRCFCSTTTVLRLTRKLGFSGYREFTNQLRLSSHLEKKSKIPSIIQKQSFTEEYLKDIVESVRVTAPDTINRICRTLADAHHVYCYGRGLDRVMANYMYQTLLRLSIPASCPHHRLEVKSAISQVRGDDVVILFCLSGEDPDVISFAEHMLASNGPTCITVTQSGKNTLANMSDFDLYVFNNTIIMDDEDLSSRAPVITIIDFITYGLIKLRG